MNKITSLDQCRPSDAEPPDRTTKLQKKIEFRSSILEELVLFASSVPDFRRSGKGNLRHKLADIIVLLILARLSKCVRRADIIEFGRHNLHRLRKMGMFKNGIPSEPTLCRVENGMDSQILADRMQWLMDKYHRQLYGNDNIGEIICIDGKAECGTVLPNGRNPDIVSAYSPAVGITLATEACDEKSNEIKAVPRLLDKIDMAGRIFTADAMSLQKEIIDKIRAGKGDFLIELKANQRSLRYGVEDRLGHHEPMHSYTDGPELNHGRIETRTYNIYDGLDLIADKDKWGGTMTIVEFISDTFKKSSGEHVTESRLYVTSLPADDIMLGTIVRKHWSIESMHWGLDYNLLQDKVRRKSIQAARNLDTIQRIVFSVFSIWKGLRKKLADKRKGMASLMRYISMSFTKLITFLHQK